MQKKEYYKHNLPHFQQPGQAYFVTWSLKDAVPKHVLKHLTKQLEIIESQLGSASGLADSNPRLHAQVRGLADSDPRFVPKDLVYSETARPVEKSRNGIRETQKEKLNNEYNILRKRYLKTYNELLDAAQRPKVDLSKPENTKIICSAFQFWEGKKLKNHAFCIMPNHVHWVLQLLEKDEENKPVYLQDILYSVKRFSATNINKFENRTGALWQKESFDTTIRDEKHLYYAVEYTLNNPVNAGFVKDRKDWPGCWNS